jgi:hypothetical protein
MKKGAEIPSIIWKDIYDIKKKDHFSIKLRGITTSQINKGHSFLIILTFKKKQRLRNLQGEKDSIKMDGICITDMEVEQYNNEIQIVDYTCKGNNTDNINLTDYSLELIEDGNNQKFLMPSNIKELTYELNEKYGNLDNKGSFSSPSFTLDTFFKITFTVKGKEEFKAKNYKFNFKIDGVLSNNLDSKSSTNGYLNLVEIDAKVNCEFTPDSDSNAHLTCDFNAEEYKDIKEFSFKSSEISYGDYNINIYDLYKITLINGENENENGKEKSSFFNKYKLYFIIGGSSVLGAILIGISIFFLIRKKRPNTLTNMLESGMKNINMPNMPNMPNMTNMPNMNNMNNIPGSNYNVGVGTSMRQIKGTEAIKNPNKIQKNKGKHDKKSKIKNRIKNKINKK